MKNILIIAAENSAENYAAQIVEQFKKNNTPVNFFGVGGDKLAQQGVDVIVHNKELAVVGIIEVISSLLKLKRYMKILFQAAVKRKADAVLLIDYPDFNLRMAGKCKKAGLRVYYYISPTVWAWRYSRVNLIKKYVDHIFIIFPFEIAIFEKENIPFTYTGHPLLPGIKVNEKKQDLRGRQAVAKDALVVTLLPGSRKSEVLFLLPQMLAAMELLKKEFNIQIFLLKATGIDRELLDSYIKENPLRVRIIDQDHGYNLINASDIVLTTCGTSNLEIAIIGVPFVAVYRVNKLSYILGKRFVKINLYSIVNILAGKEVVRELIQHEYTTENIVTEMRRILTQPKVREEMLAQFHRIRNRLTQDKHPPEIIYKKIVKDIF
ncbi:MAG: lipid-A-disaccharide synthase [Candidatus Aminicenantes bacterium]|nr:MAG: lipid-A-disaccharide synthase [Candidatus Aminicenantes bacterium]